MDYDSSTKFISSLAKFLQSLCNGYVEFDNGVQVIGHLYLNVDTGKTIDYVLNEKVCKTDENSVTFISNSFHAQPAEKPKPPGKRSDRDSDRTDTKPEELENGNQTEPRSTNVGTLPPSRNLNTLAGTKRPFSPSKQSKQSGRVSPKIKSRRTDLDPTNTSHSTPENLNASSPADTLHQPSLSHEAPSFNETYQQNFFGGDENSVGDGQEQRDVKPSFDTDVTFIKEEYGTSSGLQAGNQDDGSQEDNSSTYSPSFSSQQFHPGAYGQGGFPSNQRSSFNPAGDRSIYSSGASQMEGGDMSGDPSEPLNLGSGRSHAEYLGTVLANFKDYFTSGGTGGKVGGGCTGADQWPQRRLSFPPRSGPVSVEHRSSTESLMPSASPATSHWRMSRDMYGNPMFATCSKCGGKYTNPNVCASHETKCNGTNRLMCHICKRVYSQMCALKEHLRGKHGLGEPLKCKLCDRSFKYKPQLYDHACAGLKESAASPARGNIPQSADPAQLGQASNVDFPLSKVKT